MFEDIIKKLKETEQKTEQIIRDLKRDKAQLEYFVALIMNSVGEIEIEDMLNFNVEYDKVRLFPDEENIRKVKVVYLKD